MNPLRALSLSLVSAGLALSAGRALADDGAAAPPPAPPATQTTPADGMQSQPTPTPTPAPKHHHMRPGYMLEQLTEKLGLTPDQQKQVGAILKSDRDQMKDLRDDTTLSDEDRKAKWKDIQAASRAQIRALLTPDQQKTFDALPAHGEKPKPGAD